jgi:hypothetical protein
VIRVSGGTATTVLDDPQLVTITGDEKIDGIRSLADGRLIIGTSNGSSPGEAYYLVDVSGMGGPATTTLVNEADVLGVLNPALQVAGGTARSDIGLNATSVLLAPNGRFYFAETTSNSLLSFEVLNGDPASTLRMELVGQGLDDEDLRFTDLVWIDGRLGWINGGLIPSTNQGLFLVETPEPGGMFLSLSAICGVACSRAGRNSRGRRRLRQGNERAW